MNYQLIWFTNSVNGQDYEIKNFRKFSGLERFLRCEPTLWIRSKILRIP
jgi:hypothetical protein